MKSKKVIIIVLIVAILACGFYLIYVQRARSQVEMLEKITLSPAAQMQYVSTEKGLFESVWSSNIKTGPYSDENIITKMKGTNLPVVAVKIDRNKFGIWSLLKPFDYYLVLPSGKRLKLEPALSPDPFYHKDIKLDWSYGTTTVSIYAGHTGNYEYYYRWEKCFSVLKLDDTASFKNSLIKTGTIIHDGSVYEMSPDAYSQLYSCWYAQYHQSDPPEYRGKIQSPQSIEDFKKSHPVFFWQHPVGEFLPFLRDDLLLLDGNQG